LIFSSGKGHARRLFEKYSLAGSMFVKMSSASRNSLFVALTGD
jgi:hypothetical protein